MKGIIRERYETILFESELEQHLGDHEGAKQFAREFREALMELDQAIDSQFVLTEAQQKRLTVDQLQLIFKNASQVSMGKDVGGPETQKTSMLKNIMSKGLDAAKEIGGKVGQSLQKLNAVLDKAISSVEDKGPIGDFNEKFEQKKNEFVEKNPGVGKALDKLKAIGEKYPRATPIIIGGLVALGTFSGAPLFSMGLGLLAKTAINVAKGEAATSAMAKAAKAPLVGGAAGEIASSAVDALGGGAEAAGEPGAEGEAKEDASARVAKASEVLGREIPERTPGGSVEVSEEEAKKLRAKGINVSSITVSGTTADPDFGTTDEPGGTKYYLSTGVEYNEQAAEKAKEVLEKMNSGNYFGVKGMAKLYQETGLSERDFRNLLHYMSQDGSAGPDSMDSFEDQNKSKMSMDQYKRLFRKAGSFIRRGGG